MSAVEALERIGRFTGRYFVVRMLAASAAALYAPVAERGADA
ncbi:hypothetical protein [Salinilacihabitans rarus]|nr:hypothetical protein [Salinilacihabitans rarus]